MARRFKISDLKYSIVIEQEGSGQNEYGEPSSGWTTYAQTRAARKYLNQGKEENHADQPTSFSRIAWIIRKKSGIEVSMRVSFESKQYNIIAVQELDDFYTQLITELVE